MLWVSATGPSAALVLTLRDTLFVILYEEEFELQGLLRVKSWEKIKSYRFASFQQVKATAILYAPQLIQAVSPWAARWTSFGATTCP